MHCAHQAALALLPLLVQSGFLYLKFPTRIIVILFLQLAAGLAMPIAADILPCNELCCTSLGILESQIARATHFLPSNDQGRDSQTREQDLNQWHVHPSVQSLQPHSPACRFSEVDN